MLIQSLIQSDRGNWRRLDRSDRDHYPDHPHHWRRGVLSQETEYALLRPSPGGLQGDRTGKSELSGFVFKSCNVLFQEALKNDADVESGKPIIKESAKIDPKIGANTDAKNTS